MWFGLYVIGSIPRHSEIQPLGWAFYTLKWFRGETTPALCRQVERRNGSCLPLQCWLCQRNWKIKRLLRTLIFFWNTYDFLKRIIFHKLRDFIHITNLLGVSWRASFWRVDVFGGPGSFSLSIVFWKTMWGFTVRFENLPGVSSLVVLLNVYLISLSSVGLVGCHTFFFFFKSSVCLCWVLMEIFN